MSIEEVLVSGVENLPVVSMHWRYRVACMFFGGLIAIAGLFVPWFIVTFSPPGGVLYVSGVPEHQSLYFANMFDSARVDVAHGWVTLIPDTPVLTVGLLAVKTAAAASVVLAVTTALKELRLHVRINYVAALAGRALAALIHVGAILAFLELIWWFLVDHHFQENIRGAVYHAFNGGKFGALVALDCYAWPYVGFFVTSLGLLVSALGMYTRSIGPARAEPSPERLRAVAKMAYWSALLATVIAATGALAIWFMALGYQTA